ncbi:MAG: stage II sporulation protein M [Sedimentisphaerales bacterium]|nr:stage II sporulation protein M [Sedimentisphaerales bacterium]
MTPARFLKTRIDAWNRLEDIIGKTGKKGLKGLSDNELHELTRLYPAVAIDAGRAKMYNIDSVTRKRINQLAISAHGLLYRRKNVRYFRAIYEFFRNDYPELFRRLWPYLLLAIALFVIGFLGAYVSTTLEPSNAYLFVPGKLDVTDEDSGITSRDISERFRRMEKPPMAAGIMTNNISVAFRAFALGITAGIGTCLLVFYNAMMIGGIAAYFSNYGLTFEFWSFIAPHGVLEIFAILVSAAAGLRLGLSLAIPGHLNRAASLRTGAIEASLLVLGTIPMFVVAGIIEGFVTPSYLPGIVKIVLGISVAFVTISYLMFTGRRRFSESDIPSPQKISESLIL